LYKVLGSGGPLGSEGGIGAKFYDFTVWNIYNSEVVVCYSQTKHKTDFLKSHRPGQR